MGWTTGNMRGCQTTRRVDNEANVSRTQEIIIKINAICQEVRDMRLFTHNLSSHARDSKPVALDKKNLSLQEYVENNNKRKAW